MNPEQSRHICCPGCGAREGYRLGDGRKKCRRCGKKYSSRLFRSRLAAKTLKQIALYYWLAVPIATVARDLHLDPKTVRRHNELIQQGIKRYARSQCRLSSEGRRQEGLSLLVAAETARVEFGPQVPPQDSADGSLGYFWWYSEIMCFEAPLGEVVCQVFLANEVRQQERSHWRGDLVKLAKIMQGLCRRKKPRTAMLRQLFT